MIAPPPGSGIRLTVFDPALLVPKSPSEAIDIGAPNKASLLISPCSIFTATPRPSTEAAICKTLKKSKTVGIKTNALSTVPFSDPNILKYLSEDFRKDFCLNTRAVT